MFENNILCCEFCWKICCEKLYCSSLTEYLNLFETYVCHFLLWTTVGRNRISISRSSFHIQFHLCRCEWFDRGELDKKWNLVAEIGWNRTILLWREPIDSNFNYGVYSKRNDPCRKQKNTENNLYLDGEQKQKWVHKNIYLCFGN